MRKMWKKIFITAALVLLLCLTGLFISGTAFGHGGGQCEDNGDGTVTDNGTGLMWQKATAGPMNWDQAMSYASSLALGGYSGWGLPNKDELYGLYRSPCKNKMDVETVYWSSTTCANYTSHVWLVDFDYGYVFDYGKSHSYYVRAVRPAQ